MNQINYEAIVVGAGAAGNAAAYDLANAGIETLLIDKKGFPRHKPCAGALTVKSIIALRFSIKPIIKKKVDVFSIGYSTVKSKDQNIDGYIAAHTIREEFDQFCLNKSVESGAKFLNDEVVGIERLVDGRFFITTKNGHRYRTIYLVVADGSNSRLRKILYPNSQISRAFALEGIVRKHQGQPPQMSFDFFAAKNGYGWVFDKKDHLNVGLFTSIKGPRLSKKKLIGYVNKKLENAVEIENISGFPIATNGFRFRQNIENCFIVGDAAGLAEPLLGEGIYNAIISGQSAAAIVQQKVKENIKYSILLFEEKLEPIKKDIYCCYIASRAFNLFPKFSYLVLSRRSTTKALIKGFAAGKTFSYITTNFMETPKWKPIFPCKGCNSR